MVQALVIDPSVLIQGFMRDTQTEQVMLLLHQLSGDDPPTFHVPEFCLLECTNILWKEVRFRGMSVENANRALSRLLVTPLTITSCPELLASRVAYRFGPPTRNI